MSDLPKTVIIEEAPIAYLKILRSEPTDWGKARESFEDVAGPTASVFGSDSSVSARIIFYPLTYNKS